MSRKIVIIDTSLRVKSNSDALAESFAKGAMEAENEVHVISLKDKTISFCKGCLACQKALKCVIHDDAVEIVEQVKKADVVVFATPVYYYELSGQMKTLLDRMNPLYPSDYQFREVYLLATAADSDESAMDGPISGINGWVACFENARLAGTIFAGGVNDVGDISGHVALEKAFDMGKNA